MNANKIRINNIAKSRELTMIDLTAKPFYLDKSAIEWVNSTLSKMSDEEKLQQLFVNMPASFDDDKLVNLAKTQKWGGMRYPNAPSRVIRRAVEVMQNSSDIPLIVASNTEAGGNGACSDGTEVGVQVKIGATNDVHYAYELGRISGIEAKAVGCNCCFAPIVDINMNWRNPIISSRAFSDNADTVLKMGKAYMKGFWESDGACVMKHFPGDGVDERDQHLSSSVNSLSVEEWKNTFGKVYKGMIDEGVQGVMAGHIILPEYCKQHGEPLLPATLSKCILTDLLRGELGFNGLIISDASHMTGLTGFMKREFMVPSVIAAGCDMFLFANDYEEDMSYIRKGLEKGILTHERLNEAVTRILAFKAMLKLHTKDKSGLVPSEQGLSVVGCDSHKEIAKEVSDRAITIIKNQDGVLPLSAKTKKRLLIVPHQSENPFTRFGNKHIGVLKELLEKEGFEVKVFESLAEKASRLPPQEAVKLLGNVYNNKTPMTSLTDNYDAVLMVAHFEDHQTVQRMNYPLSKGTPDNPWYGCEVPLIFISLCCPFHLADAPLVKTYINCYDKKQDTLEALVAKLTGKSTFKGLSPVDAFCGMIDTKL